MRTIIIYQTNEVTSLGTTEICLFIIDKIISNLVNWNLDFM